MPDTIFGVGAKGELLSRCRGQWHFISQELFSVVTVHSAVIAALSSKTPDTLTLCRCSGSFSKDELVCLYSKWSQSQDELHLCTLSRSRTQQGTSTVIAASQVNPSLISTALPAAGYWAGKPAVISGKSERKGPIIVQVFQLKLQKESSVFVKPIISLEKHKINMLPKSVCHERRSRGEIFNKTRNYFNKGKKL